MLQTAKFFSGKRTRLFLNHHGDVVDDRIGEAAGVADQALGLALVFNFFDGMGGMAIVAAWWGIWHLLAGTTLATWWRRRPPGHRLCAIVRR